MERFTNIANPIKAIPTNNKSYASPTNSLKVFKTSEPKNPQLNKAIIDIKATIKPIIKYI